MAYTVGNLHNMGALPPGRAMYRYDTADIADAVEVANYFNNKTNSLNIGKGDLFHVIAWNGTPHASTSLVTQYKIMICTGVISNDSAVAAGNVNLAEVGISTAGALSSGL